MTYYKQKFLKYKLKYQQLLKQKGGMETDGLSEERKKEILDYFEELIPEKIKTLKSGVTDIDFVTNIIVQNDGGEDYIASWNHPTETQPTAQELED